MFQLKGFYSPLLVDKKHRYNIDESTIEKILKRDSKSYKNFRISSTAYVNRKFVRDYVLKKYHNKCKKCNNINDLQIDHIYSVRTCYDLELYVFCNSIDNLQVLCQKCNNIKQ